MMGFELRQMRKRAGLTQAGMAELIKVWPATVGQWERGGRAMTYRDELAIRYVLSDRPVVAPTQRSGVLLRLRRWLLARV